MSRLETPKAGSGPNKGTLDEGLSAFMVTYLSVFLVIRKSSGQICRGNENTNLMFSNFLRKILPFMR
jgi:hypothetical protein